MSDIYVHFEPRTCRICGETKPITEFDKRKNRPLGYDYRCKACGRAKSHAYGRRPEVVARIRERDRKRREAGTRVDKRAHLPIALTPEVATRFLAKVVRSPDGCWIWQGARKARGYGAFMARKPCQAHRWAYLYWKGPIPDGLELDHLCRRPSCVNPDHLEAVTHQVNMDRVPRRSGKRLRDDAAA